MKFERLPRFYRFCRAIKLFRISGLELNTVALLDYLKMSVNKKKMFLIFMKLLLLVHIIACLWATSANFEINSNINWLAAQGIQDKSMYEKYMVAFYWAIVTTATVGYGDVIPTNKFEYLLAIVIMI